MPIKLIHNLFYKPEKTFVLCSFKLVQALLSMSVKVKSVCVIGAGISGLASIKSCLEEGLEPHCFEIASDVGGIWNADERIRENRSPKLYPSLVVNLSKLNSTFSDFPAPQEWPPYINAHLTLKYHQAYAEHFDLRRHIVFNTEVLQVHQSPTYEDTGSWMVRTKNLLTEEVEVKEYDAVIAATGKWSEQNRPDIPGLSETFCGAVSHSGDFSTNSAFIDKSVLVVGSGNSGVDMATECSKVAKNVMLSSRSGVWLASRVSKNGLPLDLSAINRFLLSFVNYVPTCIMRKMFVKVFSERLDHEACGIQSKTDPLDLRSTIAVSDELPLKLYTGKVKPRPGIQCFSGPNEVTFTDGRKDYVDAVIFATGYKERFPYLSNNIFPEELSEVHLHKWVFPFLLKHPYTLSFVGLIPGGGGPIAVASELQARYTSSVLTGRQKLPSKIAMQNEWTRKRKALLKVAGGKFLFKERIYLYQEELGKELGLLPSFFRLLFTDPRLCLKVYFGPVVPYHYRLIGPHKWDQARVRSLRVNEDILAGITPIGKS